MLEITGLQVTTTIGVHDWEKLIKQKLMIDITIPIDLTEKQDNIDNTLDYDKIAQCITQFIEESAFHLIETVAEKAALMIKDEFALERVTIKVYKPSAIRNASNVSVTVTK